MTERGQVNFPSGSGRSPASVHRFVRRFPNTQRLRVLIVCDLQLFIRDCNRFAYLCVKHFRGEPFFSFRRQREESTFSLSYGFQFIQVSRIDFEAVIDHSNYASTGKSCQSTGELTDSWNRVVRGISSTDDRG